MTRPSRINFKTNPYRVGPINPIHQRIEFVASTPSTTISVKCKSSAQNHRVRQILETCIDLIEQELSQRDWLTDDEEIS